jgi:hypothetical protein
MRLVCVKSFPFNETLRQNVLTSVARVFDFYTFELLFQFSVSFPTFNRRHLEGSSKSKYEVGGRTLDSIMHASHAKRQIMIRSVSLHYHLRPS